MDYRSAVVKVLLFLPFSLRLSSAVTHTLEYSYTIVTPGSHFTSVGLLDGEEFMYYNNNTARMTPKTEWIKNETESSYWKREAEIQRDWLIAGQGRLRLSTNQGVNTLQRVYGCEIDDKNVTSGYDKSIYNGRDFISLDLNTGTWTAVDDRAQGFTENWNPQRKTAAFWKNFLKKTCIDRLQSYKSYSTKKEDPGGSEGRSEGGAEGRSDIGPEGGSDGQSDAEKTVVTVVVVLVLVAAAAAGFVIYKKKLCAHLRSGYIGARQNPKQ